MESSEGPSHRIAIPDHIPPELLAEHQQYAFREVRWRAMVTELSQRQRPEPRPQPRSRWFANQVMVSGIVSTVVAAGIWGAANRSVPVVALTVTAAMVAAAWAGVAAGRGRRRRA